MPHLDIGHVFRQFAARIPKVDLECARVAPRLCIEHPFERRIRDQAAIPKIADADFGRRKAGRPGARGGDMFEGDPVRLRIEIGEIPGANIDRADAKAHLAGIDPIKVD